MNEKTNTISEEELELGRKINTLPDEKILMADLMVVVSRVQ